MIHPTPEQDNIVESSNWPPIRTAFKNYEVSFVMLHPFLKIKPGYNINFETGNWPTKEHILECTEKLTWKEVIKRSGLNNISELDRLLAYLHCARRTADKEGWIKLKTLLDKNNIIAAEVDYLPAILINNLMQAISSLGYTHVVEYTEFGEPRCEHKIEEVVAASENSFYAHARIATPDNKILIATYFDQRFTYLSSSRELVNDLVNKANLEGFFCNETTRPDWSYTEPSGNMIDWQSPER